jgi:hypothetical protein
MSPVVLAAAYCLLIGFASTKLDVIEEDDDEGDADVCDELDEEEEEEDDDEDDALNIFE